MVSVRLVAALALIACIAAALLAGVLGGLLRAGVPLPALAGAEWLGRAALAHAALMMCGFLGTVIGIERAVAARRGWAWAPPSLSAAAGALLLAGHAPLAELLWPAAAAMFLAVNLVLYQRQPATHAALLVAGAAAWLIGNLLLAAGAPSHAVLPWWFAFLIFTIAAERLEMTRLMRRRPGAQLSLLAVLSALAAGAALSGAAPGAGGLVFGAALSALAAWLLAFDIARRTVRTDGLSRYMAVCLLAGYAWLAAGGLAWAGAALGWPLRDAALHALGLGFVFSMIMGHAPVILPAIAGVKLLYGGWFYLPLALLHLSLLLRVAGTFDFPLRAQGTAWNALAIAAFAATAAGAVLAWRHRHPARPARRISP